MARGMGAGSAGKLWYRIAFACLLAFSWVPAALPAAAAPAPSLSVTPSTITAGASYTVTGSGFTPGQTVVVHALPSCNVVVVDLQCGADGQTIAPASDGTFSQSFFSSPLLSGATYSIVARIQPGAEPASAELASPEAVERAHSRQAVAALTVRAANPSVSLSTPIIPNFFYIAAAMSGFGPQEQVCVGDFTTFGNCTQADASGNASIPLPPTCIVINPPNPPQITCLHPIAQQRVLPVPTLPMTTTVLAIGTTTLRTASTTLTIVPQHSSLDAQIQGSTLTLTARGMLPNEGDPTRGQGILFPKGRAVAAGGDGSASVSYSLACPNPDFPNGTFSLGVFGFASNLSPQTDVTVNTNCPEPGPGSPTLTASPTDLITGDPVTLTARNFLVGDKVTFSVEAPFPLTGGRLQVGPVTVDSSGSASATFPLNCCGETNSTLLTFVHNQDNTRATYGTSRDGFLHVTRPTPIVTPLSNFVHAGDQLTLIGSGYRAQQAVQLFLGDLVPCKANDPKNPKCSSLGNRGVTNLGAPSSVDTLTDANGSFSTTLKTSYLAAVDGASPTSLPFDPTHPFDSVSIQHGNGFLHVQRFHPEVSVRSGGLERAVKGSGFAPGEEILIAASGAGAESSFTTTADADGNFRDTFALRRTAPSGTYALAATGQTSGLFATTPFAVKTQAAFFRVTTTADAAQLQSMGQPNGNCASTLPDNACTLRAAVQAANFLDGGQHTISLAVPGTYVLTVTGPTEEDASAGDLDINGGIISIVNASGGWVAIDGNQQDRVFDIGPKSPAQVNMARVTIQNGKIPSIGGGVRVNAGSVLSLSNVTISGNTAGTLGGGLWNAGTTHLTNSIVRANVVSGSAPSAFGGGIFNTKTLTLSGVNVEDNQILRGTAGGVANTPTGDMTLVNVTLRRNQAAVGGASLSAGTAVLDQVTVSGNLASIAEAGFANGGVASLSHILVRGNSSGDINGGLGNGAFMTVTDALITDNKAVNVNGGFANLGFARLTSVTLKRNSASSLGGAGNVGTVLMTNVTMSGNQAVGGGGLSSENAGVGGALGNAHAANLTSVTSMDNTAAVGRGGSIANGDKVLAALKERAATIALVLGHPFAFPTDPAVVTLNSTIVALSNVADECSGPRIVSLGFNLSSDASCGFARPGDLQEIDPQVGPLKNNGGPLLGDLRDPGSPRRGALEADDGPATREVGVDNIGGGAAPTLTHALRPTSPAIDAAAFDCPPPGTDQRGVVRPQGPRCDIGAYEVRTDWEDN